MKFRVLQGKHRHSDGKVYRAGDIIESDKDLMQFKFKFERIEEPEKEKVPVSIDVKNVVPGSETTKEQENNTPAEERVEEPEEEPAKIIKQRGRPRKQ